MAGATERLAHVAELRPEICTLDCGTMNFAEGDYVMTNTPSMLREMARQIRELGVRPEIEIFDTGNLVFAKQLVAEGLDRRAGDAPALHGHPVRRPRRPGHVPGAREPASAGMRLLGLRDRPHAAPVRGAAAIVGGNVRVGLEDNIWLERGVKATNGALVERAVGILEAMNVRVLGPAEVREQTAAHTGLMRVALIGGGVIGGGWAGRLVENGIDVVVHDPHPEAERRVARGARERRARVGAAHARPPVAGERDLRRPTLQETVGMPT